MLVRSHRLQRVAECRLDVAVIDDEPRAAGRRDPPRDFLHRSGISPLQHRTGRRGPQARRQLVFERQQHGIEPKDELAVRLQTDAALVPAALGLQELIDRQRIDELVGDREQRTVGHGFRPLVPGNWYAFRGE